MSQTRSPLNPHGSTSGSIADPGDPLSYLTAPLVMAADGSGVQNVFTVSVPADKTVLQMGAGDPSGIRMSTAKHIDLAAGAPKTTICLGEAQGVGAVDGLSVFSAAQKDEHIGDKVNIWYEADTKEKIDGKLHVTVGKDAKYDYDKKLEISCLERKETVSTEWKGEFGSLDWHSTGEVKIKSDMDTFLHCTGNKHEEVLGFSNELRVGGENKQIFGQKFELVAGGESKAVVGVALEIHGSANFEMKPNKTGLHLQKAENVAAMKQEMSTLSQSTDALEKRAAALEKLDIGTKLDTMQANLVTMDAQIVSLGIAVYK